MLISKRNKIIYCLCTIIILNLILSAPKIASAEDASQGDDNGFPGIINLTNAESIPDLLLFITQVLLAVVDVFAFFMFVWGGFQLMISAGNPRIIKKAKDTLVWAVLGLLIITLSYTILKFIFEEIQKITG